MKTYTKTTTTQEPRLVISYDPFADSPREDSNLGYFVTCDRDYNSPDRMIELMRIIKETGEEAKDQTEHMELIKKEFESIGEDKIIKIYPVYKYEHSGLVYRRGTAHGWDYSNNGFYIITEQSAKEIGADPKDFESIIDGELDRYTKWANGEVYRVDIYDEDGELQDCQSGFYSLEEAKESLPAEFQGEDLDQYLTVE